MSVSRDLKFNRIFGTRLPATQRCPVKPQKNAAFFETCVLVTHPRSAQKFGWFRNLPRKPRPSAPRRVCWQRRLCHATLERPHGLGLQAPRAT
jgi:hypothetical protein